MPIDEKALSKTAAHALRHEPWMYGLELDDDGWVSVEELVAALRGGRSEWSAVQAADVEAMVRSSPKNRYELDGLRVRARYGHSIPERIVRTAEEPPRLLYHGTSPAVVEQILAAGLVPRKRQYVHLSIDAGGAREVGGRKAALPVLLEVHALDAHREGVPFYRGNELVWLADQIPPRFLRRQQA